MFADRVAALVAEHVIDLRNLLLFRDLLLLLPRSLVFLDEAVFLAGKSDGSALSLGLGRSVSVASSFAIGTAPLVGTVFLLSVLGLLLQLAHEVTIIQPTDGRRPEMSQLVGGGGDAHFVALRTATLDNLMLLEGASAMRRAAEG